MDLYGAAAMALLSMASDYMFMQCDFQNIPLNINEWIYNG